MRDLEFNHIRSLIKDTIPLQGFRAYSIKKYYFGINIKNALYRLNIFHMMPEVAQYAYCVLEPASPFKVCLFCVLMKTMIYAI